MNEPDCFDFWSYCIWFGFAVIGVYALIDGFCKW